MRKPIHGDELTIRYEGAIIRAICNEVTETPDRGAGLAKITILSKTRFEKGREAHLVKGEKEVSLRVDRVTAMGHRNVHVVSFHGAFDGAAPSAVAAK